MLRKKLGVSIVLAVLLASSVPVWGLAPGNPDIFIQVSPGSQEISAGGSATFTVSVISQEGFEDQVQLSVADAPAGVTVTFDPNPIDVPAFFQGDAVMTVAVATNAPAGSVILKVVGQGVTETGIKRSSDVEVTIVGGAEQPPAEQPPAELVTSTVTTTVTTTVVSTVTEVITTKTSPISTKTTLSGFDQASDITLPVATLVAVVILVSVAAITLRRRG